MVSNDEIVSVTLRFTVAPWYRFGVDRIAWEVTSRGSASEGAPMAFPYYVTTRPGFRCLRRGERRQPYPLTFVVSHRRVGTYIDSPWVHRWRDRSISCRERSTCSSS